MFARLSNSWELLKASAAVLRADKELVVFPILSAVALLLVTASFAAPMFAAGLLDAWLTGESQVFGVIVGFTFYLVQYFVIIFSNTALVGAALIRLRGGDPTVGDGLRIAMQRIGPVLGYALISATVGMILRWISERGKGFGQIVVSLIGLAWNMATYLVVPVLAAENVGPLDAVKRSVQLLKQTWGEQIAGNLSMGLIFGLLTVLIILLGIPCLILAVSTGSVLLIGLTVLAFAMLLIFVALINSTLNGIYTAAVYRYVAEGDTGTFFTAEMVQGAFRSR